MTFAKSWSTELPRSEPIDNVGPGNGGSGLTSRFRPLHPHNFPGFLIRRSEVRILPGVMILEDNGLAQLVAKHPLVLQCFSGSSDPQCKARPDVKNPLNCHESTNRIQRRIQILPRRTFQLEEHAETKKGCRMDGNMTPNDSKKARKRKKDVPIVSMETSDTPAISSESPANPEVSLPNETSPSAEENNVSANRKDKAASRSSYERLVNPQN